MDPYQELRKLKYQVKHLKIAIALLLCIASMSVLIGATNTIPEGLIARQITVVSADGNKIVTIEPEGITVNNISKPNVKDGTAMSAYGFAVLQVDSKTQEHRKGIALNNTEGIAVVDLTSEPKAFIFIDPQKMRLENRNARAEIQPERLALLNRKIGQGTVIDTEQGLLTFDKKGRTLNRVR